MFFRRRFLRQQLLAGPALAVLLAEKKRPFSDGNPRPNRARKPPFSPPAHPAAAPLCSTGTVAATPSCKLRPSRPDRKSSELSGSAAETTAADGGLRSVPCSAGRDLAHTRAPYQGAPCD